MLKDHTVQKTHPLLPGDFHTHLQCREDLAGTHCPDANANPSDSAKVSSPWWEGGAARTDVGGPIAQGSQTLPSPTLPPATLCPAMLAKSKDTASYSFRKSRRKPEGKRSISLA